MGVPFGLGTQPAEYFVLSGLRHSNAAEKCLERSFRSGFALPLNITMPDGRRARRAYDNAMPAGCPHMFIVVLIMLPVKTPPGARLVLPKGSIGGAIAPFIRKLTRAALLELAGV